MSTPSFSSAKALPNDCREAVRTLLLAIADTKMFLGFHYGEWTFGTPALEAGIAACCMSQDELGHLRLLHACLNTQFGDSPERLIEKRPLNEFANVACLDRPLVKWADFVAINLFTDGALTVILTGLQHSSFEPVANFIDKMVEEEKHHLRNAQGWFRTLAKYNSQTKSALEEASRWALSPTLEWLGPPDHTMMQTLEKYGIVNAPWETLRQRFLDWVGALAHDQKIFIGLEQKNGAWTPSFPLDFSQWNPRARRCAPTQPEESILYHLRGSKNAIFKLGEHV
ncbi:MAG: phenylacetate-CoA oxygenase subunit PaaI [candidate division KSB1 bacterium]|nr:phenylacetate-CoA oxygenase subunit PaaI [candidate division KSB1 bacterium]MDZ7365816.1 phenylacetate-CoA oxygenase subunit PaaI [candidate division KSB1 bacterium]MDZ7403705.1 phenylacetate-CoA oxygenase subunit PaaI [candidate division KSB1 bacterium]